MEERINIIVSGVGGQGNVLASQMMALAGVAAGYGAVEAETFGASQRGGSVMSHVRLYKVDSPGPLIPEGKADVVLGFEPMETLRILSRYGNPSTKVVVNTRPVYPIGVLAGEQIYPDMTKILESIEQHVAQIYTLNATEIALTAGNPVVANMVMVGAVCGTGILPIKEEHFLLAMKDYFAEKILAINEKAFRLGMDCTNDAAMV